MAVHDWVCLGSLHYIIGSLLFMASNCTISQWCKAKDLRNPAAKMDSSPGATISM